MQQDEVENLAELTSLFLNVEGLDQAILYFWDHIGVFQKMPVAPADLNYKQVLEGFWFGEKSCLHLFRPDGTTLQAVISHEDTNDQFDDRTYMIQNPDFGSKLKVRNYYSEDEDGQFCVSLSRPLKVE